MNGISGDRFDGGREVVGSRKVDEETVSALVDFHLDFAFETPAFIRIQDRDLQSLPEGARRKVRRMQREYVELWVSTLCAVDPELNEADARTTAARGVRTHQLHALQRGLAVAQCSTGASSNGIGGIGGIALTSAPTISTT